MTLKIIMKYLNIFKFKIDNELMVKIEEVQKDILYPMG